MMPLLAVAISALLQASPDTLFPAIGVRAGATVCEVGAGDGALTIAAARITGRSGRVFSSEMGESRVSALRTRIQESGVEGVTVVAGEPRRTNFPDGSCDAIFMRDVYHHFAEPEAMTRALAAALRSGGLVGVVDFTPPPGSTAPTPADRSRDGMHGIRPEDLIVEMREAGFTVVTSEIGNRWFMLVFKLIADS